MLSDLEAQLTLMRTQGLGPKRYLELIRRFGSPQDAVSQNLKNLPFPSLNSIHVEMEKIEKFGARLMTIHSPLYPLLLKEIANPPIILTVKGDVSLLQEPILGIVGARNASGMGKIFTTKLARDLGEQRYVVASGLARGIDTAAHKGAIKTGTVAVIGCGINRFYPEENMYLQEEIFSQGLVISEFAFDEPPQSAHFPQRNRIISGLSKGIIVVEAAIKSGSLITAHMALDQGREVFAVPGSPLDPRCQGANKLLKEGAILIENARDVLDAFDHDFSQRFEGVLEEKQLHLQKITKNPQIPLESIKESVLENLSYTPIHIDQIILECGISPPKVHAILLELELEEKIERHPGSMVALKT